MKNGNKKTLSSYIINKMDKLINSDYLKLNNNEEKYQNSENKDDKKITFNISDNIHTYNKNKSSFDIEKNKEEVLYLYRHLYKTVPTFEKNYIRKRFLREEIKFFFQEGAREENINKILKLKSDGYIVIEKINAGVYPPFPQFKV